MGIAILFRKDIDNNTSPFYKELNKLISSPGETLILSSGYFNINDTNLFNNINLGFKGFNNSKLITLSGRYASKCTCKGNSNSCHYDRYINSIDLLNSNCFSNEKYFMVDILGLWHAKISMKIFQGKPVVMIIGSSNLSCSAMGLNNYGGHESDIIIWRDDYTQRPDYLKGLNDDEYWILAPLYTGQEFDLLDSQYKDLIEHLGDKDKVRNHIIK